VELFHLSCKARDILRRNFASLGARLVVEIVLVVR
jgi:hypothetical protein